MILTMERPTGRRRNVPFAEHVKDLIGDRSQREISRLTGVSHTYVGDMLWGSVPSYQMLARFADGLELKESDRNFLFTLAGYGPTEADRPPEPTYEPEPGEGHGYQDLSPESQERVREMIAHLRRLESGRAE